MDRQKRKTRRGQYRLDNPNIKLYNIILYLFLKKKTRFVRPPASARCPPTVFSVASDNLYELFQCSNKSGRLECSSTCNTFRGYDVLS